ncbi:MAG: multicopper oxidase domain-containing protein [Nitrospirota bacterium]
MRHHPLAVCAVVLIGGLLIPWTSTSTAGNTADPAMAQEQRVEIVIRNYEFQLTQPTPIHLHMPTIVILRNQDIVRHGFASPMLMHLMIQGEGEGIAAYGKGVEGFYVDPGKTLIIRFVPERPGKYSFRCDLHPKMTGELYLLEVPAA